MKKFLPILGIFTLIFLSSCEKDPLLAFPGDWTLTEGGKVKFQDNGIGYSLNVNDNGLFGTNYFENSCDYSDTSYFYWSAEQDGNKKKGTLELIFIPEDATSGCVASMSVAYDIRTNNKIRLGDKNVLIDNTMTLNRNK